MKTAYAAAMVISSLFAAPVFATPIVQSSTFLQAGFIAFDNPVIAPDTLITNQYQALGATFTGAVQGDNGNLGIPNQDGHTLQDFISNGPVFQPLIITFNTAVTGADFSLAYQPGRVTIESFLGGNPVEAINATLAGPNGPGTGIFSANNIYGFVNSDFDKISITVLDNDHADILDNLQFVPEPGSFMLFGIAAAGLFCAVRRRGAAVVRPC